MYINKPCISIPGNHGTLFTARLRNQNRDLIKPGAVVEIFETAKVVRFHFLEDGEQPTGGEVRKLSFDGGNAKLCFSPLDRNPKYYGIYPASRHGRDIQINKSKKL